MAVPATGVSPYVWLAGAAGRHRARHGYVDAGDQQRRCCTSRRRTPVRSPGCAGCSGRPAGSPGSRWSPRSSPAAPIRASRRPSRSSCWLRCCSPRAADPAGAGAPRQLVISVGSGPDARRGTPTRARRRDRRSSKYSSTSAVNLCESSSLRSRRRRKPARNVSTSSTGTSATSSRNASASRCPCGGFHLPRLSRCQVGDFSRPPGLRAGAVGARGSRSRPACGRGAGPSPGPCRAPRRSPCW